MKKITTLLFISLSAILYGQNNTKEWTELNAYIQQQMLAFNVPGLSATIIVGDSLVWKNHFGYANLETQIPVNDSTLFCVLSIGKSITSAVAMQLCETEQLGLDQNVNDILPFQVTNPHNNQSNITPRMLMTHTSSIKDNNLFGFSTIGDPTVDLGYFMENYLTPGQYYSANNYYAELPGTNYHYCNIAPALIGYLAEVIADTMFKEFARESLLQPLEMNNSGWFLTDINVDNLATGYDYIAGSFHPNPFFGHLAYPALTFRTSAIKLSNYVMMLLNNGLFKCAQVLQPASVDSMTTIQNPVWGGSFGKTGLGLYHRTDMGDRVVWGHNGGSVTGYAAHIYFCKEENTGVVVATNSNQYVDPIVIKLLDYGALIVFPLEATNINPYGFVANWQHAPGAITYFLDLAYDKNFIDYVEGFQNLEVGLTDSYEIIDLEPGTSYYYRIRAFNGTDTGPSSGAINISTLLTSSDDLERHNTAIRITPNPFSEYLHIDYSINSNEQVEISLWNPHGQIMDIMVNERKAAGKHHIAWNTTSLLPSVYYVRLQVGNEVVIRKVMKF